MRKASDTSVRAPGRRKRKLRLVAPDPQGLDIAFSQDFGHR